MKTLNQSLTIPILGKPTQIMIQKSNTDGVETQQDKIIIKTSKIKPQNILKEYLKTILEEQATEIYNQIKKEGKIEIHGNIKFKIAEKIDNKKQRIAKLQGNTITLKINTATLPEETLKYIIAHEIAHTYIKRHTKKFWQIVEAICPNYKYAKEKMENDKSLMFLKFNC
jgi:predicted metal-dependent hydrolase